MSTITTPQPVTFGVTWWDGESSESNRIALTGYQYATLDEARAVARAGLELNPVTLGFSETYTEGVDLGPDMDADLAELLPFAQVLVADIDASNGELVESLRQPVVYGFLTKSGTAMVETAVAADDRNDPAIVGQAIGAAMASGEWDENPELVDCSGNEVMVAAVTGDDA